MRTTSCCWIVLLTGLLLLARFSAAGQDASDASFWGVGAWNADSLGNHRVVLQVSETGGAVRAHIPWRRRDADPEKKLVLVVDAKTGRRVMNVRPVRIKRAFGDVAFQPVSGPGTYFVYHMAYVSSGSRNYPKVTYREPERTAEASWLERYGLSGEDVSDTAWRKLPEAQVVQIQSIDAFNSFYPMEVIATAQEMADLLDAHPKNAFLLFPEDRRYPIRMTRDLPFRWIQKCVRKQFTGQADRGEFYAFQVGVFAARAVIDDIEVRFSKLVRADGSASVPASAFTCFNTGGIDWLGRPMDKIVQVPKGRVQPLWMGVQIPRDLAPGRYEGDVAVTPSGMPGQTIRLEIDVSERVREDAGDDEPWRHSRLRWLNSRIASDGGIVPPFTPLGVEGDTVRCLGRNVILGETGLPEQIQSLFTQEMTGLSSDARDMLAGPIRLVITDTSGDRLRQRSRGLRFIHQSDGAVVWEARTDSDLLRMTCQARMEFDGCIEFDLAVTASHTTEVRDIRLEIPMKRDVARYMMGMGRKGGFRPPSFDWTWDVKKNQDGVWVGDVNAGLQVSFRDTNYVRPLNTNFYQLKPLHMPPSWFNEGKGGSRLHETDAYTVLLSAFSGPRTIRRGQTLHFFFRLLITPFKALDTAGQWRDRYFHRFEPVETIAETGANTINVHHATEVNPFINYPFMRPEAMKAYADSVHQRGMKMKIYYTVRELSNIAPELFALFSLGDEILAPGDGGGFSWLQEHLEQNYIAGWLVPDLNDAAVINSGVSRWHNYYLEGLNWVVQHTGIDGLYIDDVAFDRTVMQRVRRILDGNRFGALIDLHSANQYNPRDGFANSANLYLEHFPYINRLWFGEYFDYNASPDFWMTEMAGIPFGLMGEMLQDGGNPWRGMVFGMTSRLPWAGDPRPIWKVWDDFGIQNSRMIGYWAETCPVRTDHDDVLATAYVQKGKTLIALASWADSDVSVRLAIDWKALGLDLKCAVFEAPAVQNFQEARRFHMGENIPITMGKGWLLLVHEEE